MRRFENKITLVTGGTSGLGEAVVKAFACEGSKVYFCGLIDSDGKRIENEVAAMGGEAIYQHCDVRIEQQVKDFVAAAVVKYGTIDIAFNNAGISHKSGKMATLPLDVVEDVFQTNVMGVWYAMRHEIAVMEKNKVGVIVNTASILSRSGAGWIAAYGMSKHAVLGLTKSAAMDYASLGLRINAISPGPMKTPMLDRALADIGDDMEKFAGGFPEGGPADPNDVAKTVLYLASDDAAYMNGANIVVDGGTSTGSGR